MAWTDLSTTVPTSWDALVPGSNETNRDDWSIRTDLLDEPSVIFGDGQNFGVGINMLTTSYNIPGFEDGYQPLGVNNPINGSLGGGGGGPTRPASGIVFPILV